MDAPEVSQRTAVADPVPEPKPGTVKWQVTYDYQPEMDKPWTGLIELHATKESAVAFVNKLRTTPALYSNITMSEVTNAITPYSVAKLLKDSKLKIKELEHRIARRDVLLRDAKNELNQIVNKSSIASYGGEKLWENNQIICSEINRIAIALVNRIVMEP